MKTCKRCKLEKPPEEFILRSRSKDGLGSWCTACYGVSRKTPEARAAQREIDCRPENRYSRARSQSRKRDIPWPISLDAYKELLLRGCYACGWDISNESGKGLDRIEPFGGYTAENSLPCCGTCNLTRGISFTVDEMREHIGPAIKAIRAARKASGQAQPIHYNSLGHTWKVSLGKNGLR